MRCEIVHNIPSPYRLYAFGLLGRALARRGVGFHVHFMARGHSGRPASWGANATSYGFEHTFWPDRGVVVAGHQFHFNPEMISRIVTCPPDILVLGGIWDSLTTAALSFLGRSTVSVAWLEGNTRTPGAVFGISGVIKRALMARHTVAAVPGADGAAYIRLLFGLCSRAPSVVRFPNIVDERRFARSVALRDRGASLMAAWGVSTGDRVAIWPARSIPAKGILPFLKMLKGVDLRGWKIVLIGEGPLFTEITGVLHGLDLQGVVLQQRYVDYAVMPALYARADLFLLPSFHDPNPLSVVEAMHSGLPLLISDRLGNFPEAFAYGTNGWAFRWEEQAEVLCAISEAFGASAEELARKGSESLLLARAHWDSVYAVDVFAHHLVGSHREAFEV